VPGYDRAVPPGQGNWRPDLTSRREHSDLATGTMSADCDIIVSLKENHDPTNQFVEAIRARMHQDFPDVG
jgi:hypothetical protein